MIFDLSKIDTNISVKDSDERPIMWKSFRKELSRWCTETLIQTGKKPTPQQIANELRRAIGYIKAALNVKIAGHTHLLNKEMIEVCRSELQDHFNEEWFINGPPKEEKKIDDVSSVVKLQKKSIIRDGNPQLEYGNTQIANELLEAYFKIPLTSIQLKIILVLWREIYGRRNQRYLDGHGLWKEMSYYEIANKINVKPTNSSHIKKSCIDLAERKIIVLEKSGKVKHKIYLNKCYKEWL